MVAFLLALALALVAHEAFSPARYTGGAVPPQPAMAVGGGEVLVELVVTPDGRVTAVTPLRTTPPFAELVADAVREWQFAPASEALQRGRPGEPAPRTPVASTVLVAAVFRPPALRGPTLGELPQDVASASRETPYPLSTTMPPYPPTAYSGGVVLLEARVDREGAVADVSVVRSAPPFDDAAVTAARQWRFRPAVRRGSTVPTFVYILFGFRPPVIVQSDPTRLSPSNRFELE
jgi:protein TonB